LPLVYVQECPGGPELVGRDHEMAASGSIRIGYAYIIQIMLSSINSDAKYIIAPILTPRNARRPKSFIEFFEELRNIISRGRNGCCSTNYMIKDV
jgi:hypothetical protein